MSTSCTDVQTNEAWPSLTPNARRRVRKTPYSRTGCSTCKRRRKKCDGCTPKCNACVRLGLECEQFDAFCPINVVKPSRSACKESYPLQVSFVQPSQDSSPESSDDERRLTRPEPARPSKAQKRLSFDFVYEGSIFPGLSYLPPMSSSQRYLLKYYFDKLSGVLVNAVGSANPLRSLIIPRVATSKLLLNAVCATAAVHMSSSSGGMHNEYSTLGTQYYVRVLSAVREMIPRIKSGQKGGNAQDVMNMEMAILATIFLCKYEIIKDGVGNWRHHLLGIESMCEALMSESDKAQPDTMAFVNSFLTYHKSIARVTEPSARTSDIDAFATDVGGNQPIPVDPYMGFSRNPILLLRRVASLGCTSPDVDGIDFIDKVRRIIYAAESQGWRSDRFLIPEGMSATTIWHLESVADAYQCAVLACLHAAIDNAAERDVMGLHDAEWAALHEMVPISKAAALTECLEAISSVPLGCPEEAGLLPLLFIVACETDRPDQTAESIQRVEALGSHIGLGNVRCTSELLRKVWSFRAKSPARHDWRSLLALTQWDLIIT